MSNNSQKGVSLIITFFILTIILAVVLAISAILYSEIKIIRNIGNSVIAFYAADSGVEKTLYYDRHVVPEGVRGLCSICSTCPTNDVDSSLNCACSPLPIGEDCLPESCTDCQIEFSTDLNGKSYDIKAVVSQLTSPTDPLTKYSKLTIDSTGSYASATGVNEVKRAIELNVTKQENRVVQTLLDLVIDPANIGRGGTVNLSAALRDSGGNPILGQQIDFSGGPSPIASCITGSPCTYTVPNTATYETYTIVASFSGSSSYAPASGSANLYVKRSTTLTADASPVPAGGGTTYVTAVLKSGASNLSGKTLILKDAAGNILSSGTTGSAGITFFYVVPAIAPGTHHNYFTVSFDGDSTYLPSSVNVDLIVTP